MKNTIKARIEQSIEAKEELHNTQIENIERAARAIISVLKAGGKLIIFGNGGSAADSQHMAAELVGRFKKERAALPAISLTTNTSILTAIANDYGYDAVFARQIEALGKEGDIALGISTSGNSKNVMLAFEKAKAMKIRTIGLSGGTGGVMKDACEISIIASSKDTPRIQESHILIVHILCEIIENEMFK